MRSEDIEIGCAPSGVQYLYIRAGMRWLETTVLTVLQSGHFCVGIVISVQALFLK